MSQALQYIAEHSFSLIIYPPSRFSKVNRHVLHFSAGEVIPSEFVEACLRGKRPIKEVKSPPPPLEPVPTPVEPRPIESILAAAAAAEVEAEVEAATPELEKENVD
jgi:hypothetical protein